MFYLLYLQVDPVYLRVMLAIQITSCVTNIGNTWLILRILSVIGSSHLHLICIILYAHCHGPMH